MIMKYVTNIYQGHPYGPLLKCDIFGVGGIVQGVGSVASSSITSAVNKAIADDYNETQIQIHEDDRQFNAEQAELNRQWNSEQAVMERRKEAGLNVSNPNGASSISSTPSNAVASAPSAPNMQMPQIESPDVAGIVDSAIALAKAPSEIKETEQNVAESESRVEDLQADVDQKKEQTEYQRIVNSKTPDVIDSQIGVNLSTSKNLESQTITNKAIADKTISETYDIVFQGILAMQGQDLDIETALNDYDNTIKKLELDAKMYLTQWKINSLSLSYQFGDYSETSKNFNSFAQQGFNRGSGKGFDVFGGSRSDVESKANPTKSNSNGGSLLSQFVNLGGNMKTESSFFGSESATEENGSFKRSVVENTRLYQKAVEAISASALLKSANTDHERRRALMRLRDVRQYVRKYYELRQLVNAQQALLSSSTSPEI